MVNSEWSRIDPQSKIQNPKSKIDRDAHRHACLYQSPLSASTRAQARFCPGIVDRRLSYPHSAPTVDLRLGVGVDRYLCCNSDRRVPAVVVADNDLLVE